MGIKSFKKPGQLTQEGVALAQAVEEFVQPLIKNPILDGYIIRRIDIGVGELIIPHSLGRRWNGWWVVRQEAGSLVWEASHQGDPTKYITLQASALDTIDIYIF